MLKDFFLLAAQSILHRRMRSWLTVIGVFIGITAVVALISIGLGLNRTINEQVSQVFGVDTFILLAEDPFGSRGHDRSSEEYALDLDLLRSIDGVKVVAALRERTGFVVGPPGPDGKAKQGFLTVMGLSPELLSDFSSFTGPLEVDPPGRMFSPDETDAAVLGSGIAERLGADLGDEITIAGDGDVELAMRVVGIMAAPDEAEGSKRGFGMGEGGPDADTVYVPYAAMERLWGEADDVLLTLARVEKGYDVDEVASRVEEELNARGADLTAVTYSDISDAIGTMTSTVSAFLAGIAGIALLVGAVGVMNTMFTSVLERTREIGVMKAVGAKNVHILLIFLIESGMMGLVGGIVGTGLGLGLSAVASAFIGRFFGVQMAVVASPGLILITLAGSFLLGAFAGLWPARRAAKLTPVEALRYE